MNRRIALKQLVAVTGAMIFAPSCALDTEEAVNSLRHISITANEEKLLSAIVGSIIPATDTPGARELGIHEFVLRMVNDCLGSPERDRFINGLRHFDEFIQRRCDTSFINCPQEERENILAGIEQGADIGIGVTADLSAIKDFVVQTKGLAIDGYLSSEFILTEVFPYELVPDRFYGCVAV